MATRLYVGNLPYSVSENDLRRLFSQAGTVESVALPLDRETGRPRGFGFVQMANDEEADNAINMFNGYNLEGRQLRVNVAQEREMRGGGGGYRRAG
jgi:RNA recognition motif-containing protein